MLNASTRAHVASPNTAELIPVANRTTGNHQSATPVDTDTDDEAIEITLPVSRKEKRRQKKYKHDSALPTPSDTDNEAPSAQRTPPNNPPKKKHRPATNELTDIPRSMPLAKDVAQKAFPLLICSIGNPGATYVNTLHSAGHVITSYVSERKGYKPFQKGLSGLVSKPDNSTMSFSIIRGYRRVDGEAPPLEDDWTFWQSTSLMNVSGNSVKKAYSEWLRSIKANSGSSATEGRLVIVHDELESALGKVTVRDGAASPKGHNGLKSCQQHLGGMKWWRVGVGIGRPESRDPNVVSRYVLGKMSGTQRSALEKSAVAVYAALEAIAAGKK